MSPGKKCAALGNPSRSDLPAGAADRDSQLGRFGVVDFALVKLKTHALPDRVVTGGDERASPWQNMVGEKYTNRIDSARKGVAVLFAVFGFGFAACVNLQFPTGAIILGVGALGCIAAAFGFFVEYLIRYWVETRKSKRAALQFTLTGMLAMMAIVASTLAVFRMLGTVTIVLLITVVIVLACSIEVVRRKHRNSRSGKRTGGQH